MRDAIGTHFWRGVESPAHNHAVVNGGRSLQPRPRKRTLETDQDTAATCQQIT
jgi:hypothetical protein